MQVEPWPNNMGLKMRSYWESLRECIENLRNILGTCWGQIGNIHQTKNSCPPPPAKPESKKTKLPKAFSLAT